MARPALDNLKTYETPKERLRNAFWMGLRILVLCYVSWDLSVYSIGFFENPRVTRLIVPLLLAAILAYTIRLCLPYRHQWWPIIPAIIAFIAPIALHVLEQPVQPNSRFLSDAYESAQVRASSSAPKPGR
jgi:hypothetical protein